MKLIKIAVLLAVMVGAMFGVNSFTAPIIEANNAGAALGVLKEVMPEATGFELIYANDGSANELTGDTFETVVNIYKETSGLGYVVQSSTSQGYTHEPIEFNVAIDATGTISNVLVSAYPETKDVGTDFLANFAGKDSALAGVDIVGGVTFSSSAIIHAIEDGFNTLIASDLIGAGVKSNEQILKELLPNVAGGFATEAKNLVVEEVSESEFVAANKTAAAVIVNDKLVIANASLSTVAYDVEGKVVEASADEIAKAVSLIQAKDSGLTSKETKKADKLLGEGYNVLALNTFNSVYACLEANGQYLFVVRPYHFSNEPVSYYYLLNADGSIANMSADEFIIEPEFFTAYTLDEAAYKEGFVGVTADTYSDDLALVSGATFSSSAARVATKDVFEAFASLKGE